MDDDDTMDFESGGWATSGTTGAAIDRAPLYEQHHNQQAMAVRDLLNSRGQQQQEHASVPDTPLTAHRLDNIPRSAQGYWGGGRPGDVDDDVISGCADPRFCAISNRNDSMDGNGEDDCEDGHVSNHAPRQEPREGQRAYQQEKDAGQYGGGKTQTIRVIQVSNPPSSSHSVLSMPAPPPNNRPQHIVATQHHANGQQIGSLSSTAAEGSGAMVFLNPSDFQRITSAPPSMTNSMAYVNSNAHDQSSASFVTASRVVSGDETDITAYVLSRREFKKSSQATISQGSPSKSNSIVGGTGGYVNGGNARDADIRRQKMYSKTTRVYGYRPPRLHEQRAEIMREKYAEGLSSPVKLGPIGGTAAEKEWNNRVSQRPSDKKLSVFSAPPLPPASSSKVGVGYNGGGGAYRGRAVGFVRRGRSGVIAPPKVGVSLAADDEDDLFADAEDEGHAAATRMKGRGAEDPLLLADVQQHYISPTITHTKPSPQPRSVAPMPRDAKDSFDDDDEKAREDPPKIDERTSVGAWASDKGGGDEEARGGAKSQSPKPLSAGRERAPTQLSIHALMTNEPSPRLLKQQQQQQQQQRQAEQPLPPLQTSPPRIVDTMTSPSQTESSTTTTTTQRSPSPPYTARGSTAFTEVHPTRPRQVESNGQRQRNDREGDDCENSPLSVPTRRTPTPTPSMPDDERSAVMETIASLRALVEKMEGDLKSRAEDKRNLRSTLQTRQNSAVTTAAECEVLRATIKASEREVFALQNKSKTAVAALREIDVKEKQIREMERMLKAVKERLERRKLEEAAKAAANAAKASAAALPPMRAPQSTVRRPSSNVPSADEVQKVSADGSTEKTEEPHEGGGAAAPPSSLASLYPPGSSLKEKTRIAASRRAKLLKEFTDLKNNRDILRKKVTENEAKHKQAQLVKETQLKRKMAEREAIQLAHERRELDAVEQQIQKLKDDHERAMNHRIRASKQITDALKNDIDNLSSKVSVVRSGETDVTKLLGDLQSTLSRHTIELTAAERDAAQSMLSVQQLQTRLGQLEMEVAKKTRELEAQQKELSDIHALRRVTTEHSRHANSATSKELETKREALRRAVEASAKAQKELEEATAADEAATRRYEQSLGAYGTIDQLNRKISELNASIEKLTEEKNRQAQIFLEKKKLQQAQSAEDDRTIESLTRGVASRRQAFAVANDKNIDLLQKLDTAERLVAMYNLKK